MHQHYKDILDRIAEPPKWFDDAAVPRYGAFAPADLADIHADEAALAEATLAEPFDGVMVELALPHSHTILAAPDRLIDLTTPTT